jgi:MFS family permease
MTMRLQGSAAAEWRQHWLVVLAAGFGISLATVHLYSIGVMLAPIEQEFGWSRAQITSGLLVSSVFGVIFSPFMGFAIDRFGARRIAIIGTIFLSCALASLSLAASDIRSWWILWTFVATATLFTKPTVWAAGVSSLFASGRGLALSITFAGSGIGSALTPLLTFHLIEHFGWRAAYIGLACFWGGIAIPLTVFLFVSAKDLQRRGGDAAGRPAMAVTGLSPREGLTSFVYIRLALAAVALSLAATAVISNVVPILTSAGLTRESAATIASAVGISTIVGRLSGGYFLDRFNAGRIAAICAALPIASCLLILALPGDVLASLVAVSILGLAFGAEYDAVGYLASRLFGMRSFGVLFGTIIGLLTFVGGMGPTLANHAYDVTGSYELVLRGFIPCALLSSLLFLTLGPYPDFEQAR